MTREENFIDISQAVKIKLEVTENDSYNSNEIFESEATMHEGDPNDGEVTDGNYQHFKIEGHSAEEMGLYSEFNLVFFNSFK